MDFAKLLSLMTENEKKDRDYSCLMLDLSFLKNEWKEIQDDICPCELYDKEGYGLEDEIHSTVLYGIHTNDKDDVWNAIDLRPVNFEIGKLSLFSNPEFDVLKFDIISKDLNDLNKECCRNLDYTNKYKKYHAHATVAYLKKDCGEYYTKEKNKLTGKIYTSDKFIFSTADNKKYKKTC